MLQRLKLVGIGFALLILGCCHSSRIQFSPHPSQIERIEGFASLRVTGEQGSARSKFSFLFHLPNKGRIDVSDILGRTIYQIIIKEDLAYLVVPSKKGYWEGAEEDIIEKFLGFRLDLREMIYFFGGQWNQEGRSNYINEKMGSWIFERDDRGRIKSGERRELRIEIKEFFKDSPYARILIFGHPLSEGRLKILHIGFNQFQKKDIFSIDFLNNFDRKTWEEIQEILK